MHLRHVFALALLIAPVACDGSGDEPMDAAAALDARAPTDASAVRDASADPDARVADVGVDAGPVDAQPTDADAPDAEQDAGPNPCGDGVHDEATEACDPGLSECCAADCSGPATSVTECRGAAHECDAVELCDGTSLDCPIDEALVGGETCVGCPEGAYCAGCYEGACADSRTFCADLLDRGLALESGIYEVRPSATASVSDNDLPVSVYCDMTTNGGGWTMVYKKSRLDGRRGDVLWTDGPVNASDPAFLDREFETSDYSNAFQNDYWNAFAEARIEVLTATITQSFIEFDLVGSTNFDWFSPARHTASNWTDLPTDPAFDNGAERAFRIPGTRSFYINRVWNGCGSDRGWMMITTNTTCSWENTPNGPTEIIYSRLTTESHIPTSAQTGYADSLVIFLR